MGGILLSRPSSCRLACRLLFDLSLGAHELVVPSFLSPYSIPSLSRFIYVYTDHEEFCSAEALSVVREREIHIETERERKRYRSEKGRDGKRRYD